MTLENLWAESITNAKANNDLVRSNLAPEIVLEMENKLDTLTEIFEQGCFFCGDKSDSVDYEHDHCIDICEDSKDTSD